MNTFMDGASELPFGGYKQSGLGRELGRHAVEDYTETKTLNMHIGSRTNWWMPRRKSVGVAGLRETTLGARAGLDWAGMGSVPPKLYATGRFNMRRFLTATDSGRIG